MPDQSFGDYDRDLYITAITRLSYAPTKLTLYGRQLRVLSKRYKPIEP